MDGHYFVSYSRIDGAEIARRLADQLVAGPPSHAAWLDVRDIQPGTDWDEQIRDAIQGCRGLLFLMTSDSVRDGSGCKYEWVWALKYKKPVIPVRIEGAAELPFRLSSREYIDFSGGFDQGLARLRSYLDSVGSPRWVLQELRDQLTEAERELPRADPSQRPRVEEDIRDLGERIADQQRLVADPTGATRRTEERIAAGMEQERHPERPAFAPARAKFVNPAPVIAPGYFQDRHVESDLIGDFLRADDERIMTVVGRGGVGKTAMVCRLLKALEGGRLPDDLGELEVDGIVYLSPAGEHPLNFPNLFTDLCRMLPGEVSDRLLLRYRDPQQTPAALMRALLDSFRADRVVVLLDQLEDVIDTSTGEFPITDAALDEALRALLAAPAHGVKVILTTRVAPRALLLAQPERQRRLDLDQGLGSPHAERVLRARDPDGRLGLKTATDEQLDQARQRTRGYPRALEALAAILAADRNTTLPELLAQAAPLPDNVVETLVGAAFNRLDPLAQQVMQTLAVFAAAVPSVAVDYLLQPYRPAIDAAPVLARLVNMQFVRREAGRYYLHQVDRDYALGRVPAGEQADRQADPAPFTRQALRHRGADYFERTRTPRADWKTLDDLAPQLNEYELRCQGEDYDTAAHVLFGIDFDYLYKWGHYRLTAELHQRLQGHLDDPMTNAFSKGRLGNCYQALGQIPLAIDLYQQTLTIFRKMRYPKGVAAHLGNLGDCHRQLGELSQATDLLEQALTIAREIGNREIEVSSLSTLGICHHQLGELALAFDLYEQALTIARQFGRGRSEPLILSCLGIFYRDLGELPRAIDLHQQALTLSRETGDRYTASNALDNLANAYGDLAAWGQASEFSRQAIAIADALGSAQVQNEARLTLARIHLLAGDPQAAHQVARAARDHPYPLYRAQLSLLLGITQLRQGQPSVAAQEFRDAAAEAGELLQRASGAYAAQDTRALASCGLTVTGEPQQAAAIAAFRAARAITSADGIVAQVLALFDALAAADQDGLLAGIRPTAAGTA